MTGEARSPGGLLSRGLAALREPGNRHLIATAFSLVAATGVTSVLGFAYWSVAARGYTPAVVGIAATAISAMSLLSNIGLVGLGTVLIAELPRRPGREAPFIASAISSAALISFILGLAFTVVVSFLSSDLTVLAARWDYALIFAIGIALNTTALLLDQIFIGLLRGGVQLWRNGIFALSKLGAIVAIALLVPNADWVAIYGTWAAGNALSIVIAGYLLARQLHAGWAAFRPDYWLLWSFRREVFGHNVLNLSLQSSYLLIPLVVTAVLSSTAAAYYYMAVMLAGFIFVVPLSLTTAVFAVGSRFPGTISQRTRFSIVLSAAFGVAANLALVVLAGPLLRLFGPEYQANGELTLRILGLAVFPLILKDHFVAICRVTDNVGRAARLLVVGSVAEVVLAGVGAAVGGLPVLAVGWVLAICGEAAFAFPVVAATLRREPAPVVASPVEQIA
jgi:O-antigen/teichoic acid export membrane protein